MESLALHEVDNLVEYVCELEKCKDGYLICAAVRDTLHGIDESSVNALKSIGMNNIGTGWNGYVFLKEGDNIVLDEGRESNSSLIECKSYRGMQIQLVSKSWRAGNKAMIVVNDYNFAVDSRGLNIVVLDVENRKLVDSVCFDFFPNTKRPCIRDKYFMQIQIPVSVAEKNQENIFDIDEKIDNIIGKYHFDRYHPRYSKFKKARKLIKDLSDEWKNYESIACIMIGYSSEKMELDKKNFLSDITLSKRNQIDFFSCKFKARLDNPPPFTYAWEACDYKILEHIVWGSYSRIYVISNCGENFIGEWFRKHKIQYVSLYDYFLAHGVFDIPDDSEYYNFIVDKRESRFIFSNYKLDSSIWEIYDNNQKLKDASVDSLKLIYAKKLFFLFLTNKNFISAKKYLDEIISLNQDETEYVEGWQEINDLIGEIKRRIKQREKRDIISIWVDFLGYEDTLKFMPFVSSLHGKSIWFNNFFSMNGFTHETQRTIFTGKNLIEDQTNYISNINLYNSPLLRVLEKNGYKIVVSGKYLQDLLCARYESQRAFADREIESGMLWDAMRTMLMTESPCFIMLHCLQSHYPYVFDGMDDKSMFSMTERTKAALSNLDSQIRFYLNILGKNATSIIFNDHGNAWYWPRQHVLFTIAGEVYRQREVNDVCSLVDFHKVVKQLIDYREIKEEELSREAAEFQGVPVLRTGRFTNPRGLLTEAKPAYWPIFRGYKGIVTKEYVYIHFAGGREWLSRRDKMQPKLSWYARPDDICDKKILLEMRDKAGISYGNEPPDYGPRSEYYLSIQETYEKNYSYNAEKNKLVNALVADMPDSSVALYLGNGVSRELYLMLSLDSRKKISFIIDKAADCSCADLGVPIIPLEKVVEQDVRHIIVPMRTVPGELSDFLQTQGQGIHAFGLYGWFEVNGYHTKHNFYDFAIQSMDAPLPSPLAIPDFLHYASLECVAEVAVAVVVHDEKTLLARLHGILKQVPLGIEIHCLDLTGKVVDVLKDYQKVESAIKVISIDDYASMPAKLNELLSSVNSKYIFFLSADEYLHAKGLFCLHEIAEQTEADLAAAGAVLKAEKKVGPSLADFAEGAFELKKEAHVLPATFKERSAELNEEDIPDFAGNKLYRVDFLRKYGIRFQDIKSGWKDIFCFQTIFGAPKYVKAVSPVCISSGNTAGFVSEDNSAEYAKKLVESMFAYQQSIEAMLKQWCGFGNNPSLCDAFRERAMTIFDQQYFSGIALNDEISKSVSQAVQEELQKNPSIGMWWIKYLFMRSSFPQNV